MWICLSITNTSSSNGVKIIVKTQCIFIYKKNVASFIQGLVLLVLPHANKPLIKQLNAIGLPGIEIGFHGCPIYKFQK